MSEWAKSMLDEDGEVEAQPGRMISARMVRNERKRIGSLLLIWSWVIISAVSPTQTGVLTRSLNVGAHTYKYFVYVPRDYDSAREWPVILFLHGAGERGKEQWKSQVGIAKAVRDDPSRIPAIVVL